ncbi:MAG: hypothetical protein PUK79_03045, partial [Clostridiales bacterium]|nr:hypothetical protein [Clostridiales bacterium]
TCLHHVPVRVQKLSGLLYPLTERFQLLTLGRRLPALRCAPSLTACFESEAAIAPKGGNPNGKSILDDADAAISPVGNDGGVAGVYAAREVSPAGNKSLSVSSLFHGSQGEKDFGRSCYCISFRMIP